MRNTCSHRAATPAIAMAAVAAFVPAAATADSTSGTINYQSKSGPIVVNVTNVYMIKGPDAVSHKAMRELIFTSADVGAKLQTCASMMCASGNVLEGMTVDFDVVPRLNYWVVGNGQKVQYSGTVKPDESLKLIADSAEHLAGSLTIDDSATGGATVNVKFDATIFKQFSK